jgi:Salmonella virulence plasmid 28.1kDa A protein
MPSATHLSGLKLDQTVLATLTSASVDATAKANLSDTLNAALKAQLAGAATSAGYANLAKLIEAIPEVDVAADKNLTLHDFVSKEVVLPTDATQKAAAEAAIAKLSTTTKVSDLLGLKGAINGNPILAGNVKMADLATMLKTSPTLAGNAQLIDDFINQYAASKGRAADFWNSLAQNDEFKAAVPELQLTLQLATLTRDNPQLVAALRARYPHMTSPRALTAMTSADWQQLITSQNIPVPASISGATAAEKAASYGNAVLGTLKGAFPGTYFAQGLQSAIANAQNPVDRGVATFLNNAPSFDFVNSNLNQFIAQNGQAAFQGIDAATRPAVTSRLAAWQRVARVTADFPTAHALSAAGFTSAYGIASTPRASFTQIFSAPLGGKPQAEAVFDRAQQITGTTMAVFSAVRQGLNQTGPRAIGNVGGQLQQYLGGATAGIPNWQTLFGSLSSCACTDCRSVYSAAAYFVDLLQFLKKSPPNGSAQTPLDVLLTRRPDLPYIKLNCENTDTPLPYVDLVNEILEGFVVLNSGKLDRSVAHDTAKDATPAQLSVSPQYVNDDAYNKYLNAAIYPPSLPFDRWLETARTYLTFLTSSLYQVMAACQTGADASDFTKGTPSGIALACESLGIGAAECAILTGKTFSGQAPANPPPLYQYYGYAAATVSGNSWEQDVAGVGNPSGVENFLQRTAIAYDDLVALLQTRALNPNLSIMLQAPGDPGGACDLTKTTIVDLSTAGNVLKDTPTLDRMHRFIRLWKKLGWSIEDLDKAMTALQAADIDQQFLVSLATVKQIEAALNLPLLQVLAFWNTLDTDGRDSLYLTLFQNRTVLNPPDGALALQYTAPLPGLPTPQFPSPRFPNIGYDATGKMLSARGSLGDDEYAGLKALSTDAGYDAAIAQLHATMGGASPPPVASVALASLPVAQLPSGLGYDANKHDLSFAGAMADDYRAQLNFSNDPAYQAAVDAIYNQRTLWGTEVVGSATQPGISSHVAPILAALRISAQDLALIRTYANLADPDPQHPVPLTLANLSTLCRYAFLAQGLGLSVRDLLTMIALIGVDPFAQPRPRARWPSCRRSRRCRRRRFRSRS